MTYNTLTKICAAICISPIVLGLIGFELTESLWMILFFGGLAFAILFHQLSEQDEEIQTLRFPKKETEEDKRFAGFMDKRKKDEIEAAKDIFALSPKSRKELYKQMGLIKDEKDEVTPQKSEEIQVIFYKKNLNKLKDNDKN